MIHAFEELVFLHLIRNLGDNDLLSRCFAGAGCHALNDGLGADGNAPSAGGIHRFNAASADDTASCREIGAGDVFHERFGIGIRVIQFAQQRVNNFAQVVRRDARQVADTYACGAVEKQIGQQARQHRRLL